MPKTCCVTSCRSVYKNTNEEVSHFCFRTDAEQPERRMRAHRDKIQSAVAFEPKYTHVREGDFPAWIIIQAGACIPSGDSVPI